MSTLRVSSDFVGMPWEETVRNITWRDTTNYAAALDDPNPAYFDDERSEGIFAPPMFVSTLGWPLAENIYARLPDFPRGVHERNVHYTAYTEYYAPLRPGSRLLLKPCICHMRQQRSGVLCVFKFPAFSENGDPVYTEYMGVLCRDVELTGGDKGESPQAPRLAEEPAAPLWETAVPISKVFPYVYDGCTGIRNPIHTSPKYAHSVDLPDIITQGTTTIAFGVREVTNRELSGDPAAIKVIAGRLTAMVFPGDCLRVQCLARHNENGIARIHFRVLNSTGKTALSDGYLAAAQ